MNNIFISHYSEDEQHLERLKSRLKEVGCAVRNSSVEKKDYRDYKVSDATIAQELRDGIKWAGTVIVLIGAETYTRPWVNYEIRSAYLQGKKILGIYEYGCKDSVELPEAYERYGGPVLGWNSLDKISDVIKGKCPPPEKPSGAPVEKGPITNIIHIKC